MNEPHALGAAQLRAAYAARRLSPVEVVRALLERIAAQDGRLHAFVRVDAEGALAAAQACADAQRAGRACGALHGIPVAIKDNIDVAGVATTCHSRLRLDHVAAADAPAIARLRAAGAIVLGKLALHEFATGAPDSDLPFPPARNPWNPAHQPGGSSSGAAAALAAGLVPLALGTDTGGSIRGPAALCGVVGLKPTYGLVPRAGVFPLAFSLDHVGPMARCAEDTALMLDALSGAARSAGAELQQGAAGLRIGYVRHFHENDLQAEAETAAALDAAARDFAGAGATVRTLRLPPLAEFTGAHRVLMQSEAWRVHARWLRECPQQYAAATRRKLLAGAFHGAGDYVHAQQERARLRAAVAAALADCDLLLTANTFEPACRLDDPAALAASYARQARSPFNLTGHPALSLMCGVSRAGLPLSLQLVARPFAEATLLRAAAAYERLHAWQARLPLH